MLLTGTSQQVHVNQKIRDVLRIDNKKKTENWLTSDNLAFNFCYFMGRIPQKGLRLFL